MTLEHELRRARAGIPELDAAILGSRQDPVGVGGESDGQDEVAMTLERLDALSSLIGDHAASAAGVAELPHLDGAVQ